MDEGRELLDTNYIIPNQSPILEIDLADKKSENFEKIENLNLKAENNLEKKIQELHNEKTEKNSTIAEITENFTENDIFIGPSNPLDDSVEGRYKVL